jgi:hypothetical protein
VELAGPVRLKKKDRPSIGELFSPYLVHAINKPSYLINTQINRFLVRVPDVSICFLQYLNITR